MNWLWFILTLFAAPDFFSKVDEVWEKTPSYKAKFKQVIKSKALGTQDESYGTIMVFKPGRLLWLCDTDKSTQILKDNKFTYLQDDPRRKVRMVDIWEDVSKVLQARPIQFLAGKLKLKEAYRAEVKENKKNSVVLKLTDKTNSKDSYLAEFDRKSYLLLTLVIEDQATWMELTFTDIGTGQKLDPKLFEVELDPKKDIVTKH